MAYRLTDASALGLDLARTPGGVEAAGVLLRLLLAGPADVRTPVRARADLVRARLRAGEVVGTGGPTVVDLTTLELPALELPALELPAEQPPAVEPPAAEPPAVDPSSVDLTAAEDVAEVRRPAAGAAGTDPAPDVLARRLRRLARRLGVVSFGTVADLLALGRDLADELSGGPGAGPAGDLHEVVADALLAALVGGRPDPAAPVLALSLGHRLDPPEPALPALPALDAPGRALRAAGTSPVVVGVARLLERVAAAREEVLLLEHRPAPQVWADHMHGAAWAVETTGRTRLAAAAQLELLRCLDAAGVTPGAYLGGVWNACSAAVQAQVVADVLPSTSTGVLSAELLAALPRP